MIKHSFVSNEAGVGHWTTKKINSYRPGSKKILDLACGRRKIPGAVGLDADPASGADIVADAEKKLPFKDGEFDEVFCLNFLEHTFKFDEVLTEIYRVLKPSGILHIEVPYYNSFNFGQLPFHHIMWCETTIDQFYTKKGPFKRYTKSKFNVLEQELFFTKPAKLIPASLRIKAAHFIGNLCYQIYWKLEKD
ncbi:MAG: class I SAM-dependent methyltransferase [Candidatus Micrarchaeota archaeon]